MITTCIRSLGSLPVNIEPERNIEEEEEAKKLQGYDRSFIMASSRSDSNLQTLDGIP